MDLRQASYVVAVVDHGSFTAAAASIPVSQPALSQSIAGLERELGTELFHRIGRRVVLTPAGEAFVEPARRMLREADVARAAVTAVTGLTTGHLDLVSLPTMVVEPLVDLVGAFRSKYPNVLVRIREPEDGKGLLDQVRSGESELGFGDTVPDESGLIGEVLGSQRVLAVLPPGTDIGSARSISATRLATFALITTPQGTSTRRMLSAALRTADPDADPAIGVVTEHREAIVPLVMAGAGAALLPEPLARGAAALGAVVLPLAPRVDRDIVLLRRPGPLSPAAVAFTNLALAQ